MDSHSMLVLLAIGLFAAVEIAADDSEWNYQDQDAWKDIPGAVCGGDGQSPVNIITKDVNKWSYPQPLEFSSSWRYPMDVTKVNNGHSVQFTPKENVVATVENYKGVYKLSQFHVHWGTNSQEGSEHRVDSWQAAAEFHFVLEKVTGSISDDDHYSVMGVLAVEDQTYLTLGNVWKKMLPPGEGAYDASEDVNNLDISQLFPIDLSYFHYQGSLTTPPCNETVQWFVFSNVITVPALYLQALGEVQNEEGEELKYNFRDTQPLNGRTVYYG